MFGVERVGVGRSEPGQAHCAAGRHRVLWHAAALGDHEVVEAGGGHQHRHIAVRVEVGVEVLRDPPTPTRLEGAVGDRGHPFLHLVGVGEQLVGQRRGQVVGLGGRTRQRADVADHRELAGLEQVGDVGTRGMQAVLLAAGDAALRIDEGARVVDRRLGDRHLPAHILVVARLRVGADRNDEIVGVHAAAEEHADKRLVVVADDIGSVGGGGGGLHQLQLRDHVDQAGQAESGAGALSEKGPARGLIVESVTERVRFHRDREKLGLPCLAKKHRTILIFRR